MTTTDVLLGQILDSVGDLQKAVGSFQARLDHGDSKFDEIKKTLDDVVAPLSAKIVGWEIHVAKAIEVHRQFDLMEPEFKKMKVVVGRFSSVAMASGAIVGAALWAMGSIWPYMMSVMKMWVSQHLWWH